MSDDEEYEFEYSDNDDDVDMGDDESSPEVAMENKYYLAKAVRDEKHHDENDAVEAAFQQVLDLDELGESIWGFRALKQLIKWEIRHSELEKAMKHYEQLLHRIATSAVITRNMGEKGVNGVLDFVSAHPVVPTNASGTSSASSDDSAWAILQQFYETTLATLQQNESRNERLWFKTNLKLGNLLFDRRMDSTKQSMQLLRIVKELLASCEANAAAVDDDDAATTGLKHDSQLLEVYALQIQLYTVQKDNKKLVELYEKALRVKPGVAHPRIVGVIRECGGKMHMMQGDWEQARNAFFEGFKNFDEAGEARRLQCLKYLVLANMLGESKINVFDSQEAKPYEQAKEIVAMTQLTDAFMNDDIKQFETVLNRHGHSIMSDGFIKHYVDNLLRTIRSKVVLKVIKPYQVVRLAYIASVS
ncbi:hypothetical protein, variant 2 [Aphanomyces astaci]|uniref:PCI domain-containing protein n=1 Tax=Aphanomyces astaci TaxID=112090 RepID=W4FDP2_APHAT|nr:hypothetical protein, variant 2 [Aphanomyces astaci]ETV65009.1 hypothetical protein, variant 2 [Aphanomyces astaci]|eukprot:XP_009845499.1 hypothetical protein, variant 2 [Aphanomyces astaci]